MDPNKLIMRMGEVHLKNEMVRHTAFDPDVVFHEFTHAVTNCLVGGSIDTCFSCNYF
jgi:extracellular elastinolytic metalloproteinase